MSLIQQALEKAGRIPLKVPEGPGTAFAGTRVSELPPGPPQASAGRPLAGEIFKKTARMLLNAETFKVAGLVGVGFLAFTVLFYLAIFVRNFVKLHLPSAQARTVFSVQKTESASMRAPGVFPAQPPAAAPSPPITAPTQTSAPMPPPILQSRAGMKQEQAWMPNFVLTGVTSAGDVPLALINNEIVRVGDRLPEGAIVREIQSHAAVLEFQGKEIKLKL